MTRVAVDAPADAAVMKTKWPLKGTNEIMPYKLGQSADLHTGNFVYVRGYPLGEFQAVNVGRVSNPFDEDREAGWNHSDFIVDAALSNGHSGSPVFAVSCKTASFELVGMYHAGYRAGSALNAVIAIDDLRELMETMKAPRRGSKGNDVELSKADRTRLTSEIAAFSTLPVFPFAGSVATLSVENGALRLTVLDRDFPQSVDRRLWIVDRPEGNTFGEVVEVGIREENGNETAIAAADFDAKLKERISSVYVSLARAALAAIEFREQRALKSDKRVDLTKHRAAQRDALEAAADELTLLLAQLQAEKTDQAAQPAVR
jgi:serine protease Do